MSLKSPGIQRLGGGWLEQFGVDAWSKLMLRALGTHKRKDDVDLIRRMRRQRKCLLTAYECYMILSMARGQTKLPGDFAEVGVYQGGSARLICEVKGDRHLRLFDTFAGLPKASDQDSQHFTEHLYACSVESVRKYLDGFPNVSYHVGIFPESARDVPEAQYAFVHFDVDLYDGTLACLEYFYPRMAPGGILISHDYSVLKGVEKAFADYMADKPEPILELPTTQVMVVKR